MSKKPPIILRTREEVQNWREQLRQQSARVGFVPTMGALHQGHCHLLSRARSENDVVVLSIFVNPAQFGQGEDFSAYPRTFQEDLELAQENGVDAVFYPTASEIYPSGFSTRVGVGPELSLCLEGAARPGHFDGVCLVVSILLNLVDPDRLYLGQKDYQQCVVLRSVIRDLGMRAHCEIVPTVRDFDGLALSSRNRYLSEGSRLSARILPRAMNCTAQRYLAGERRVSQLLEAFESCFAQESSKNNLVEIEYLVALELWGLKPIDSDHSDAMVIAAVMRVNTERQGSPKVIRLLDNLILQSQEPWIQAIRDLKDRIDFVSMREDESRVQAIRNREGEGL